jgi:3-phenylpropionate/cinnamic acid dioxygenase small subunit
MAPAHGGGELGGDRDLVSGEASTLARLLLKQEVEEFLYREADLLDERRYEEWLDLFAEDAHYWMPLRRNVPRDEPEREFTRQGVDANWFDEGKDTLRRRVRQILTGLHWAEEPPSRICHIISNIQLVPEPPLGPVPSEVGVRSRFIVYRNRVETETDFLVGKREDLLRREGGDWRIARRKIVLDQSVLLAKNLTMFF